MTEGIEREVREERMADWQWPSVADPFDRAVTDSFVLSSVFRSLHHRSQSNTSRMTMTVVRCFMLPCNSAINNRKNTHGVTRLQKQKNTTKTSCLPLLAFFHMPLSLSLSPSLPSSSSVPFSFVSHFFRFNLWHLFFIIFYWTTCFSPFILHHRFLLLLVFVSSINSPSASSSAGSSSSNSSISSIL